MDRQCLQRRNYGYALSENEKSMTGIAAMRSASLLMIVALEHAYEQKS